MPGAVYQIGAGGVRFAPFINNSVQQLLASLFIGSKMEKPVVVYVTTNKGKGYVHAEGDPTLYHGVSPFSIVDGKIESKGTLTFTEAFSGIITKLAEEDDRVVGITAAMADGTGLRLFQTLYPRSFFDVGIAEQHAITFASGLAIAGHRPIVAIYSTFLQRAVDQVIHDIDYLKESYAENYETMFVAYRSGKAI